MKDVGEILRIHVKMMLMSVAAAAENSHMTFNKTRA